MALTAKRDQEEVSPAPAVPVPTSIASRNCGRPLELAEAAAPSCPKPPPLCARGGSEVFHYFQLYLHHRHDDELRDALAGLRGIGLLPAIPYGHHRAGPDNPSRSGPRDCRARCRACDRDPSAEESPQRDRGLPRRSTGRWAAAPPCPAPAPTACRGQARRSRPAEPAVAYWGSGNSLPMRASRIRTLRGRRWVSVIGVSFVSSGLGQAAYRAGRTPRVPRDQRRRAR